MFEFLRSGLSNVKWIKIFPFNYSLRDVNFCWPPSSKKVWRIYRININQRRLRGNTLVKYFTDRSNKTCASTGPWLKKAKTYLRKDSHRFHRYQISAQTYTQCDQNGNIEGKRKIEYNERFIHLLQRMHSDPFQHFKNVVKLLLVHLSYFSESMYEVCWIYWIVRI